MLLEILPRRCAALKISCLGSTSRSQGLGDPPSFPPPNLGPIILGPQESEKSRFPMEAIVAVVTSVAAAAIGLLLWLVSRVYLSRRLSMVKQLLVSENLDK